MNLSFTKDKWSYYLKSKDKLQQLNSYYPCKFCNRHEKCYYDDNDLFHDDNGISKYRYYICKELYDQIEIFKDQLLLINFVLKNNLNTDLNYVVSALIHNLDFKNVKISCFISKEKEISNRLLYLNYKYDNLTIKELKTLLLKRNLKFHSSKKKDLIVILTYDLNHKTQLWKNDDIGL